MATLAVGNEYTLNGRIYQVTSYLGRGVIVDVFLAATPELGEVVLREASGLFRTNPLLKQRIDDEPKHLAILNDTFNGVVSARTRNYPRTKENPQPSYFPACFDYDPENGILVEEYCGKIVSKIKQDRKNRLWDDPTFHRNLDKDYMLPELFLSSSPPAGIDSEKWEGFYKREFTLERLGNIFAYYAAKADAILMTESAGINGNDALKHGGEALLDEKHLKIFDWNSVNNFADYRCGAVHLQSLWLPLIGNFVYPLSGIYHETTKNLELFDRMGLPNLPPEVQELITKYSNGKTMPLIRDLFVKNDGNKLSLDTLRVAEISTYLSQLGCSGTLPLEEAVQDFWRLARKPLPSQRPR